MRRFVLGLFALIGLVTGMVVEATRGERGFFMLKGRDGELHFKHGRNIDDKEILTPELKISHGIARDVAKNAEPVLVEEDQRAGTVRRRPVGWPTDTEDRLESDRPAG